MAVARFKNEADMLRAIDAVNEKDFEGRVITIHQFLPRDKPGKRKFDKNTKSYKYAESKEVTPETSENKEEEKVEAEVEEKVVEEEKEEKAE